MFTKAKYALKLSSCITFFVIFDLIECQPDCKTTTKGTEYVGKINVTRTGNPCQEWNVDYPHKPVGPSVLDSSFPDGSRKEARNYCRNPDNDPKGPWCYDINRIGPRDTFDYCNIPMCQEKKEQSSPTSAIANDECRAPGILWDGNCYMYFNRPRNFWDAAANCDRRGGRLADVSQGKKVIQQLWANFGQRALDFGYPGFWVGAHSRRYPGSWFCSSRATCLKYWKQFVPDESVWATWEPNNVAADEGCAVVRADGLWDQPCSIRMGYICQMDRKLSSEGCSGPFPDVEGARPDKATSSLELNYKDTITYNCFDGEEVTGTCQGSLGFALQKGICTSLIENKQLLQTILNQAVEHTHSGRPSDSPTHIRKQVDFRMKGTPLEQLKWASNLQPTKDGTDFELLIPELRRKFQIGFRQPNRVVTLCVGPSGLAECRFLRHCVLPRFQNDSDAFINSKYICFEGNYVGVCCDQPELAIQSKRSACILNEDHSSCGQRSPKLPTGITKRISGGMEANPGDWPWAAALFQKPQHRNTPPTFICGGVVLGKRHVLTAAHCIIVSENYLIVRLGEYNLTDGNETSVAIDFDVERTVVHERYNPRSIHHDIAIVVLKKRAKFTCDIWNICFPVTINPPEVFGTKATIIGWGATEEKSTSDVLNEVSVTVYSELECASTMRYFKAPYTSKSMVCARVKGGHGDSCLGDSGGPLMVEHQGAWFVIGIVSAGEDQCGNSKLPGVYTRVDQFTQWITNTMAGT